MGFEPRPLAPPDCGGSRRRPGKLKPTRLRGELRSLVTGASRQREWDRHILVNRVEMGQRLFGRDWLLRHSGGIDLCVVIRTILLRNGRAYLHTGGGIVADSNPEEEWRECLVKARLLEAALDQGC